MSKLLLIAPTEGEEASLKFRRKLWEDKDFTDVTLEVLGGEKIHCHSVIIAAASPVLRQKLLKARQNQMCLDLEKEDSCSALVLKKIMEFMYLGECQVPEKEIKMLLETGKRLQVQGLCLPREGSKEGEAKEERRDSITIKTEGVINNRDNVVALLECGRHNRIKGSNDRNIRVKRKLQEPKLKTDAQFNHQVIRDVESDEKYSMCNSEFNSNGEDVSAGMMNGSDNSLLLTETKTGLSNDLVDLIKSKIKMLIGDNNVKHWHCTECSFKSNYKVSTFYHIESKHVETHGHVCPICDKLCLSLNGLRRHQFRYKHRGIN